nr:MAG TPA: hypothetical protein [Caudoviricetes sp.]
MILRARKLALFFYCRNKTHGNSPEVPWDVPTENPWKFQRNCINESI